MTQVTEKVAFEVGGAQVLIPKDAVAKNWLASLASEFAAPLTPFVLGTLSAARPILAAGEKYGGVILGKDGEADYHLILLPDTAEDVTWEQAKERAIAVGGDLPNRREQSLLFANLKEEFESAWYWSSEQSERNSLVAWNQNFGNGGQNYNHKTNEFCARFVRRSPL
ncbi:DUF1566 domain-containing protein [Cupriavidus basilensis]|uniref:DUF1566 domain-containing protein n=1 Tax=Cupriavidus basilensis TaxID=68895 RepID=A0ABT6AWV1_9BURK|nr:DUF1566 domain-containing protein [Cupriavidus basilensis]MDF3837105.1 DUF1566 domain-containing protein [Cupriavidus basilensis]